MQGINFHATYTDVAVELALNKFERLLCPAARAQRAVMLFRSSSIDVSALHTTLRHLLQANRPDLVISFAAAVFGTRHDTPDIPIVDLAALADATLMCFVFELTAANPTTGRFRRLQSQFHEFLEVRRRYGNRAQHYVNHRVIPTTTWNVRLGGW